jgi:hypothetical protein
MVTGEDGNGVHFNYVATVWENPLTPSAEDNGLNGIYGLYPVGSQNVLIENSYSKGSSDAGIYAGQTSNIVVRNNIAEENVVFNNTNDLLIFDLDGLEKACGSNIRILNNHSYGNNLANAGSGFVEQVSKGTSSLVLASDGVEIFKKQLFTDYASKYRFFCTPQYNC